MALAVDSSTPAYAAGSNDPWVTASFTPPNDSLLVVVVTGDWFGGTPTIAPTSSGLVFTSQGKFGALNNGVIEVFTAPVGSNGGSARTVSVTTTISSDVGGAKVYVVTDYYAADPVEAVASNTGAPNGTNNWTPTVLTTAADGCWVFGGAVNWVGGNLASTSTDVFEEFNDADLSVMVARKSAATSPAGAVTLNFDQVAAGTPVWTYGAIAIRPSTYTPPAIHKVADRGSAQNLTSQSSTAVDLAAGGSITTGNMLVARVAMDNSGTSGAARTLTVTDTRSNTWTVTAAANRTAGSANDGSTCYIAYAPVTNAYSDGDDLTFTYSGSVTAKAIVVEEWAGIDTTTPLAVAAATATGGSTAPSIARTPAAAGQLFYGALSVEGPTGDTVTQDSDTIDGTWQTLTRLSTTSGTAASNQTINGVVKFVSGTSAQTWNPTITSRDWAQVALVFAAASGITGTAAPAQAADTPAASGQLGYSGTSARTEAADTSTASGTVVNPVTGTSAASQASQTASASGKLGYTGTSGTSQAANASSASGQLGYSGTSARTQANQTSTASGQLGYSGTAAATEAADTSSASGTFTGTGISGNAAATQAANTAAASGQLGYSGSAAANEAADTSTATGQLGYSGSSARTQAAQTSSAAGQLGYSGTASPSQAAQTSSASGTFTSPGAFSGSAAATQASQTGSAAGKLGYSATAAPLQANQTSTAAGTVVNPVTGTASPVQAGQFSIANGILRYTGTATTTQTSATSIATGVVSGPVAGSGTALQANQTVIAVGTFTPLVSAGTAGAGIGMVPYATAASPGSSGSDGGALPTATATAGHMTVPSATGG